MARKQVGLGQKSVARMLGYKSTSPISEYETGRLIPSLRTAFKLAILYNLSLQELYAPLYGEIQQEIEGRRQDSALARRAANKGASLL
jgi:transcriptional regulator with XRE-family HTH domain